MSHDWDVDNMELMEDDCLRFIKLVCIDFYLHKYNKICGCIFLVFHVPMWIEQFYQYFRTCDFMMMAQYGPASFVFLYAYISILVSIFYEKTLRYYLGKMETSFWSLNTVSKELCQTIKQWAKYTVLIVKLSLVLALITYFTYILKALRSHQWEVIYQVTFLKTYFPSCSGILIIIFYITLSYIIIPMMFIVHAMVYGVMHGSFQSKMLNEYISRITENYTDNCELLHDEIYQKRVFHRLRFCVARGATLRGIVVNTLLQIHNLVVLYTVLGMCLIFYFIASYRFIQDIYYLSFIMLIGTSTFCGLIIIQVGQNVEDGSVDVYNSFIALPWHTFDSRNRKMLLAILLYSAQPLTISPFRDFPVNRTLIVKFYKVACSVYALASNMGERIQL